MPDLIAPGIRRRLDSWLRLESLSDDFRQALRTLRRAPAFSVAVVVTLGLGIGANAAMFGVVDRLMFRPFPFLSDADRVHRVYLETSGRRTVASSVIPYTRHADLVRGAEIAFDAVAAVTDRPLAVGTGSTSRELPVAGVSGSFFGLFDARPRMGRFFGRAEDVPPLGAMVAVLGHDYWKKAFGGEPVLGRSLAIGTVTYAIIGVAPAGFVGVTEGEPPAVYIPITTFPLAAGENKVDDYYTRYNWDWTTTIVRRRVGTSREAADAALTRAFVESRARQRATNPALSPDSIARPKAIAGAMRTAAGPVAGLEPRTLLWVTGVAIIVLLIACANVSNLMFARVLERRREISVRLALGVSRVQLMRLLVVEGLLLAGIGCIAGVALAQWGGLALRKLVLPTGTSLDLVGDARTLVAAAAFALAAGLITAIGPILLAMRTDLATTLKPGSRGGTPRSRARSALLIVQAALSVVLLIGAHLFVRSLDRVRAMPLGYDPAPVLMVQTTLRGLELDSARTVALRRRVLAAAQAIPGVVAAARVNGRPFGTSTTRLIVAGIDSVERLGRFNYQAADPEYFAVMATRIVRGRGLSAEDGERAPKVVVVSASMARTLWPEGDALGRCLTIAFSGPPGVRIDPPCRVVVGIAEDAVHQSMIDDPHLMYYLPTDQVDPSWGRQIFLRVTGDAESARERVRLALDAVMPGDGYVTVQPLDELIARQQRSWRLGAAMFGAFGVLALLVAAVGVYGVISYDVAQRMRELGIRIALGARARQVIRLVVADGLRFASIGVGLGIGLAMALAGFIQPLLFRQSARDPVTYLLVGSVLLVVAIAASALPAARAAKADPNAALRSD